MTYWKSRDDGNLNPSQTYMFCNFTYTHYTSLQNTSDQFGLTIQDGLGNTMTYFSTSDKDFSKSLPDTAGETLSLDYSPQTALSPLTALGDWENLTLTSLKVSDLEF